MIEKLLDQSVLKNGYQVSFILNQRILTKAGRDWVEMKGDILTIEEWEDLKDLCLQGNEKVQLETKGYISGLFQSENRSWKYSFIEKKDCYRAHLCLLKESDQSLSLIENTLFWDSLKKESGLFVIAGERMQGKTALINEIMITEQANKLRLVGLHATVHNQNIKNIDSVVPLGLESLDLDSSHIIYEGIEKVIVDTNNVKNWKKWIELAEQGQNVILTISLNSVQTFFSKILSEIDVNLYNRLLSVLNGVVVQKLVGADRIPCHEIFILHEKHKNTLKENLPKYVFNKAQMQTDFKEVYQTLNQSLVQRLIRRKIDVQAAFEASDDPDLLDVMLKKMGL